MTNKSAVVQVATWNDFGEGTIVEPTREYGFRDLGIIQDLRRQYLDASFPYQTNDVTMAYRLYNLRKQFGSYPAIAAELNRIFTNICSGKAATANLPIDRHRIQHPGPLRSVLDGRADANSPSAVIWRRA